jgi:hypothetical protein
MQCSTGTREPGTLPPEQPGAWLHASAHSLVVSRAYTAFFAAQSASQPGQPATHMSSKTRCTTCSAILSAPPTCWLGHHEHDEPVVALAREALQPHRGGQLPQLRLLPPAVRSGRLLELWGRAGGSRISRVTQTRGLSRFASMGMSWPSGVGSTASTAAAPAVVAPRTNCCSDPHHQLL